MRKIALSGNASGTGTFTIASPDSSTDRTLNLPDNSGTVLTSATTTGFPAGSVLQVVSVAKTDTFSIASSSTYADITGLSVSITPTSATSKILVIVSIGASSISQGGTSAYRLVRASTAIGVGTPAGSRQGTSFRFINGTADGNSSSGGLGFNFLDSPATTSSTTYKLQVITQNLVPCTGYINVSESDTDTAESFGTRAASTITVMEISA